MADFTMPSLGADMDEGTLAQWLVHPGDHVTRGDVVAVVETTKSAIEVECFQSGTVDALLVAEGTTVPVGTPLARIGTTAESAPTAGRPPRRPWSADSPRTGTSTSPPSMVRAREAGSPARTWSTPHRNLREHRRTTRLPAPQIPRSLGSGGRMARKGRDGSGAEAEPRRSPRRRHGRRGRCAAATRPERVRLRSA